MDEQKRYLEWPEQTDENDNERSHRWWWRYAAITWVTAFLIFAAASCGSWADKQIRQQERIASHKQELAGISYELRIKIDNRKKDVADYNRLLAQCKADPTNRSLQNYTMMQWKKIMEENKEIERLMKKKLNKTVRLNDEISKSQYWWVLEWRPLTDENYYDFLFTDDISL